jgi:hypothetical protein
VSMRQLRPMSLGHAIFEECDWFGHGLIYTTPPLHPGRWVLPFPRTIYNFIDYYFLN